MRLFSVLKKKCIFAGLEKVVGNGVLFDILLNINI